MFFELTRLFLFAERANISHFPNVSEKAPEEAYAAVVLEEGGQAWVPCHPVGVHIIQKATLALLQSNEVSMEVRLRISGFKGKYSNGLKQLF